jgi:hypothetical protein
MGQKWGKWHEHARCQCLIDRVFREITKERKKWRLAGCLQGLAAGPGSGVPDLDQLVIPPGGKKSPRRMKRDRSDRFPVTTRRGYICQGKRLVRPEESEYLFQGTVAAR